MSSSRIPKARLHKATGQTVVTLSGRAFYCGPWNKKSSRQAADRLIGEWLAAGRCLPDRNHDLTVVELAAAYKRFAKDYYGPGGTYDMVKRAMRLLADTYGPTMARSFGPLAFKALRFQLDRPEYTRSYVNRVGEFIRRAFKWAVGQELIGPETFHALQAVPGLRKGRSIAREPKPIRPVEDDVVEATLSALSPVVADMVRLQRLTGMRPDEVCQLRPLDVDRNNDVWTYRPARHKTDYRGRDRLVMIGPKAQVILLPYLLRAPTAYCFSPRESETKRRADLHRNRKTAYSCGNVPGSNRRRRPARSPGTRYDTHAYRRAIHRACDQVNKHLCEESPADGRSTKNQRAFARWSPNRLRHTAGTEIRRQFGLEAAQVTLGHAKADVTQVYAERDLALAAKVMRALG